MRVLITRRAEGHVVVPHLWHAKRVPTLRTLDCGSVSCPSIMASVAGAIDEGRPIRRDGRVQDKCLGGRVPCDRQRVGRGTCPVHLTRRSSNDRPRVCALKSAQRRSKQRPDDRVKRGTVFRRESPCTTHKEVTETGLGQLVKHTHFRRLP